MRYRTIVADPPWDHSDGYGKREGWYYEGGVGQRALPYQVMSLAEIEALPVGDLASQTLVWHKTNASPFSGSVAHGSAEFLVVGVRGSVPVSRKASSSVLSVGHHHDHSRKPDAFLDLVEQVSPGPYLELFARRQRLGWDTWGNEALPHVVMPSDELGLEEAS